MKPTEISARIAITHAMSITVLCGRVSNPFLELPPSQRRRPVDGDLDRRVTIDSVNGSTECYVIFLTQLIATNID